MNFDDNEEVSDFFGKAPLGGTQSPISPGFGMSGVPGDFRGGRRAPQSLRGSRADALVPRVPAELLAPDSEPAPNPNDRQGMPAPYIDDIDIDRNWFSPFQPVYPFGPPYVNYPREWDYPVGVNLEYNPARFQLYSMLRALAEGSGIISTVREARIDELVGLPWKFTVKDTKTGKDSDDDPRIQELNDFFKKPDRKKPYPMWMRMIFRDRYTIDAASAYIWRNKAQNKPYAIEALDGASIKPLIDDSGRIPDWPNPAYQQIIKGMPMNNYTEREIIYMPARPRTEFPIMGYSEIEQILMEATQQVRKTLYMLNFWKEGTIPDVMLGVPESWTPEQIATWQASFDALLSGNLKLKSKIRFIPGGMKPFEMKGSAGDLLKSDYDEWMARIVFFCFRMDPKPMVKEPEPRSNAEQMKEQMRAQGLNTEMVWWSAFMEELIRVGWGWTDIKHVFNEDEDIAATDQATVDASNLKVGARTVNELRERDGLDPVDGGDEPMVYTGSGAMPLKVLAAQTALPVPAAPGGKPGAKKSAGDKGAGKAADSPLAKRVSRWNKY
ncbi:MAG TPA: phage portal protein [Gemmataceae bacterium]|jgi:hypothetical protein|nr:phage portal protein [Gemmataceae bacterium]